MTEYNKMLQRESNTDMSSLYVCIHYTQEICLLIYLIEIYMYIGQKIEIKMLTEVFSQSARILSDFILFLLSAGISFFFNEIMLILIFKKF